MVLILTDFCIFPTYFFCQFSAQHLLDINEWLLDVLSLCYFLFQRKYGVVVVRTQEILVG